MTNPSLRDLVTNVDSKYSLVVAVAKRARQIVARKETTVLAAHKPVTIALMEVGSGKVKVVRKQQRAKEQMAEDTP